MIREDWGERGDCLYDKFRPKEVEHSDKAEERPTKRLREPRET